MRPKPVITSSKISRMPCLSQISRRRSRYPWADQHAGRSGHRLDDDGRDVRGIVQRDQPLQLVGEMRALLRLPARVGVLREVVRVLHMVDRRQHCAVNTLRLATMPPTRDAAEADTVIAALAPISTRRVPSPRIRW